MMKIMIFALTIALSLLPKQSIAQVDFGSISASEALCYNNLVVQVASTCIIKPGPDIGFYTAHPYYKCTTNRYVSTTGSSGNNGLTAATPWDVNTAQAYAAPGGTCINVAPGTYDVSLVNDGNLVILNGGTSSTTTGYVVWRCSVMPFYYSGGVLQGEGSGCVLTSSNSGPFQLVDYNTGVNYVMFDGFEFLGEPDGGTGICNLVGGSGGVGVTNQGHHIWVLNSDLHNCNQAGIAWTSGDWLFVIHNHWHDNSQTAQVSGSGMSFYSSANFYGYTPTIGNPDYWHSNTTGLTYNNVIAYNVGVHNYNHGCWATDGEGLIIDSPWENGYTGAILIMGNILYNNGGGGIQPVFWVDQNNSVPLTASISNGSGGAGTILNVTSFSGSVLVTVGMTVSGTGIPAQTIIIAELSGTGMTGTYTVNQSLNISSESMTGVTQAYAAVTVVNNTVYGNNFAYNPTAGMARGGLLLNAGSPMFWLNNISKEVIAANATIPNAAPYNGAGGCNGQTASFSTNSPAYAIGMSGATCNSPQNSWQTNITYPGGVISSNSAFDGLCGDTYATTGPKANIDGSDPQWVGTLSCAIDDVGACTGTTNFSLKSSSPAVGAGQDFDLWQQPTGPVDIGACVRQLASCP